MSCKKDCMDKINGISVIVPNYNGEKLLAENLPSLISSLETWAGKWELIVVDDCSEDGSCALLQSRFPVSKVIRNSTNMGFSKSCNRGMSEARYPIAFCVNNDVRSLGDFISPVLEHFSKPDVFAVTPAIIAEKEGKNQGVVIGEFGKGFLRGGFAGIDANWSERENLYAIGACVAYDAAKFSALGGYSEIYSPYLFEDVDISYRAWKRGWRNVYEPAGTVYHVSSATIGKEKKMRRRIIYFRNRFLFHWINLTDTSFIFRNLFHTFLRLSISFLWFDFAYYASFLGAVRRLRAAMKIRESVTLNLAMGDREIIARTCTGA
jgi:GT2 family glycosyltransferase